MSLVRTMLPYTLRHPYRMSTYKSEQYRALWPAAKDYLSNLCEAANGGVVDMIMPGWQDYALTIHRPWTSAWRGQDPPPPPKTPTPHQNPSPPPPPRPPP